MAHAIVTVSSASSSRTPRHRLPMTLQQAPSRCNILGEDYPGRRTHYWIIYTVDDDANTVDILDFWNTSGDPAVLDL